MKKTMLSVVLLLATGAAAMADDAGMHQYVIERDIPGAAELSAQELRAISQKSRAVLESLGPEIKWSHSYVAEDKFYCVYTAPSAALIRKHAEMGGFPADRISMVSAVIDPSTAD
jgi:DNA-binding transcriptional regulator YdaS (Cro superfamily)